jgi:DNA polymerase III subunit delta
LDLKYDARKPQAAFDKLARVYAFHGADDLVKDQALAHLRNSLIDESFAEFDCEVLPGDTTPASTILSAACSAPFGSRRRLVIVRAAETYGRRERQSEADALAAGLKSLGELSCLVLRIAAPAPGARAKTILSSRLDAAIRATGSFVEFPEPSRDALIAWIESEASSQGKEIDHAAAERVADSSNSDRIMLANELAKVIAYAGDRKVITVDDADQVCGRNQEEVMFKLLDAMSARQADRTLHLFHDMLRYEQKPQAVAGRLLSMIARQLRMLWQARELATMRIDTAALSNLPAQIADDLPSDGSFAAMTGRAEWRAKKLFASVRTWDRDSLATAITLVMECDLANKGADWGGEDVIGNLQMLLLRLCTEGRSAARGGTFSATRT